MSNLSPAPGKPQGAEKAWAGGIVGAIAPFLPVLFTGLVTGNWPTPETAGEMFAALGASLAGAATGAYAVWRTRNSAK